MLIGKIIPFIPYKKTKESEKNHEEKDSRVDFISFEEEKAQNEQSSQEKNKEEDNEKLKEELQKKGINLNSISIDGQSFIEICDNLGRVVKTYDSNTFSKMQNEAGKDKKGRGRILDSKY